jgi:hypothetical protein
MTDTRINTLWLSSSFALFITVKTVIIHAAIAISGRPDGDRNLKPKRKDVILSPIVEVE